MRARWPDGGERRRALGAALAGSLDPLAVQDGDAVARWIAAPETPGDRVETVVLTSPDPDDLTLRQARALALADRVTHRADVPSAILERARADAERIACDAPPPGLPGLTVDLAMAR
jgi:uroporphyrin-III C-methyltransferase/precorrin-2 dehydrogenase/sirohydrochlorin ferrochelatase